MSNKYPAEGWLQPGLGARLDKIKEAVRKLHHNHNTEVQLKWYTPHGESHYDSVEHALSELIPADKHKELTENERFFLLASAWVHDIGMIKGILDNDFTYTDEQIREDHHTRSEKYITRKYNVINIEECEAVVFSLLAKYHRRRCPISECPETLPIPKHGDIRVRLLAAYLRLADALHIDQTRAPKEQYAITLAYNIPINSKLHWLRSMFVIGVRIDTIKKELTVHLKRPNNIETWDKKDSRAIKRSLRNIYELIVQDLTDELNTVKEVLFRSNLTSFLSVNSELHHVEFDERLIRDIKTIMNYYFLMDNPSSSALCRLMFESILGIIDAHSRDEIESVTKQALNEFLDDIKNRILSTRHCHTGLWSLLTEINDLLDKKSIPNLKSIIEKKIMDLEKKRNKVRYSAFRYFQNHIKDHKKFNEKSYDILLYGYSELAIKSLCGFRDAIINKRVAELKSSDGNNEYIRSKLPKIEEDASKCFRIFICEAQPKDRTAWGGRIVYHDGIGYALSLVEREFTQVYIVADAIAGTLISPSKIDDKIPKINFVIIGANGFDNEKFSHSAGHATIAAVTRDAARETANEDDAPKLILSLITDKCRNEHKPKFNDCESTESYKTTNDEPETIINNGWKFRNSFSKEPVRNNIFISQDQKYRELLRKEAPNVHFYNPREDIISIEYVDVVFTEEAWIDKKYEKEWNGKMICSRKYDSNKAKAHESSKTTSQVVK